MQTEQVETLPFVVSKESIWTGRYRIWNWRGKTLARYMTREKALDYVVEHNTAQDFNEDGTVWLAECAYDFAERAYGLGEAS